MKKALTLILTLCMCLTLATALTACDLFDNEPAHTHQFTQNVATEDFIKSDATCLSKAIYYKSCPCGEKGSETFESGELAEHNFSAEWTKGDGKHWHVCQTTTCTATSNEEAHHYTNGVCVCGELETTSDINEVSPTQWENAFKFENVTINLYLVTQDQSLLKQTYFIDGNDAAISIAGAMTSMEGYADLIRAAYDFTDCYDVAKYQEGKYFVESFDAYGDGNYVYEDAYLTFENGVLKSISATIKEEVTEYDDDSNEIGTTIETNNYFIVFVDYDETEIVLPQLPISQSEWESIFATENLNNVTIAVNIPNVREQIYVANNTEKIIVAGYSDIELYCIGSTWYTYHVSEDTFAQTDVLGPEYPFTTLIDSFKNLFALMPDLYSIMSYDAEQNVYYYLTDEGGYTIAVENGKVVSFTQTIITDNDTSTYSYTLTNYGTTTFTVPFDPAHVCDFQEIVDESFLVSEATCKSQAIYHKSCSCGKAGTETFEHGNLADHDYVNDICSICYCERYSAGLTFTLSDDETYYSVSRGNCSNSDIIIPSVYESLPVAHIEDYAFYGFTELKSVSISGNVTSIGSNAFYNCTNLKSLSFSPNSMLTEIGSGAFSKCSSLEDLFIPHNVTSIGGDAFENCTALTNVTIPSSVTSITSAAFYLCPNLTNLYISDLAAWCAISFNGVYANAANPLSYAENLYLIKDNGDTELITELIIPEGVTSIGNYAFYDCSQFTTIQIPDSVISIGTSAFYNCSGTASITIPSRVKSIGDGAFLGCNGITSITIPSGVEEIGSSAFAGCDQLQSVLFDPNSACVSIGSNAFYYCENLKTITLPEGITSIGAETFCACYKLASITIPSSVTSIGDSAFFQCYQLESVVFAENSKCEKIDENAFYSCIILESLEIPDSVTYIGYAALRSCQKLESLTLPFIGESKDAEDIKDVLGYIFGYETSSSDSAITGATYQYELREWSDAYDRTVYTYFHYYIPATLTSVTVTNDTDIGKRAFYNCSNLTAVTIGDSVEEILDEAFYGCDGLTTLTIPFVGRSRTASDFSDVLGYIFGYKTVYTKDIPGTTVQHSVYDPNAYGTRYWHYYIPAALTSVTVTDDSQLGKEAFYNCANLTQITINGDADIAAGALYGCSKLNTLTMPSACAMYRLFGATDVKDCRTYVPETLKTVTINGGTNLPFQMFCNCINIESIYLPAGITDIYYEVFKNCIKLTNIHVDEENTAFKSIDGHVYSKDGTAFVQYAIGKTETTFTIPQEITKICNYAFYNSKLENLSIPASVVFIDEGAFDNCSNLQYMQENGLLYLGNTQNPYIYLAGTTSNDLTTVTINQNCKFIGYQAFYTNRSLESIVIPSGVTHIGAEAFGYCYSLSSITIPASVSYMGRNAFYSDPSLIGLEVYYNGTIEDWCNIEMMSFGNPLSCNASLFLYNEATEKYDKVTSLLIPATVTGIKAFAFTGCTSITSVSFANGTALEYIEQNAFSKCTSLKSITLPNGIKSIGAFAFNGCTSLSTINFNGTKAEWELIEKDYHWNFGASVTSIICSDGTISIS